MLDTNETAAAPEPRHGEERNRHEETEHGPVGELVHSTTGEVVFRGSMSSHSYTVTERYCAGCREWFRVAGVMGALRFHVEHFEPHAN